MPSDDEIPGMARAEVVMSTYSLDDLESHRSNPRGFYDADDAAGRWLRSAERKLRAKRAA